MNCMDLAIKAAKGKLTDQEIRDAFDREQKIRAEFMDSGRTDNLDERVARKIAQEAMAKKIEQARQKRAIAQNIIVRARLNARLAGWQAEGMSPVRALLASAEGSQMGIKSARDSMDARQAAFEAQYIGDTMAHIEREKPHLFDLMADKGFDNAVTEELFQLREGGTPGKTGNADAQWLAKVLGASMEFSRTDLNRKGAAIGRLDGYAGPQSHDDLAMLGASKDGWVAEIKPLLDMERSFPDAEPAEVDGILSDIYDTIITGGVGKDSAALYGRRVSPSSMATRLGAHRVLHFRDAQAAIAYRDKFGRGSTIQGIFSQLKHHARIAGAMDTYGPNPPIMFKSLVASVQKDMAEKMKGLTGKELETARKQLQKVDIQRLNSTLEEVSLLASRPVSVNMAQIGSNIRAWQSMAKLGGASITAVPTDTVTQAAAAMFRGQGFWKGFTEFARELVNRKDGKEISYLLGEGFDSVTGHIASAVLNENPTGNRTSRWTYNFFRWNGLSGWTDTARAVAARVTAAHMGANVGKSFDQLHPKFAHVLDLNAITPEKWDAIRSASYREVNDRVYVTPDRIRDLPDDVIERTFETQIEEARAQIKLNKKGEITQSQQDKFDARRERIIEQGRRDLEIDLRRYFADEARYAIVETDMASRRFARAGTRPGTMVGEAVRMIMQFKAFPIAFSNRILGRAFKGGIGETPAQRLLNNKMHIGTLLSGLTVAGYAAMTVKDTLRGQWPPRDPFDIKTVTAALMQGGTFGIYGDFLTGQVNRFGHGPVEALGGPMVGVAADVANLKNDLWNGNPRAGRLLDMAVSNTPYLNLFYVRPVMDFLWINSLRDTLSPGYLARQAKRSREERGQGYTMPRTLSEALN